MLSWKKVSYFVPSIFLVEKRVALYGDNTRPYKKKDGEGSGKSERKIIIITISEGNVG